jgi:hypothetical protein
MKDTKLGKSTKPTKLAKALLTALTAASLFGALSLAGCSSPSGPAGPAGGDEETVKVTITVDITAAVDAGDATAVALSAEKGGSTYSVTVEVPVGSTVLQATQASDLVVATSQSSFGPMVDSIDGLAPGITDTSGWTYTVNDEQPIVGADAMEVNDGDVIVWQFVTSWE